jgi:hypothetical protein
MAYRKMPKEVTVGPYTFQIKGDKASMDAAKVKFECLEAIGFTSTHEQCIYIDPDINEDMRSEVLLHEILHAVCEATGINSSFEEKEEEQFIATVSPTLLDTLRRNETVLSYLLGDVIE